MRPARATSVVRSPRFGDDWWQRGVIYQIYPRSFADSDGDGVGDLQGIIEHLDYLGPDGLGVDAIWLSPIYPSPGLDLGYDVTDHERVDPLLGSEEDFDRLVVEAHQRGIRVVLDLVMNHTSDQHHWFQASRQARTGPYADRYLWRDPGGRGPDGELLAPNNWVSFFGGPGWTWEPAREQFYFHTFLVEQPELDWRAPTVEEDQFRMVRGWLDRGVDGFRLDVFNVFLKDPELRSNPTRDGSTAWARQIHLHDRDQPDFPALIERFRAILDDQPGRMSVGEMFDGTVSTAADLTTDRHLVFDWELTATPWKGASIATAIAARDAVFGAGRWPTAVLSNHDQPRHATRLAGSANATEPDAVARAAAVLLLTVRGTPFLFYGEELGMGDVDIPPEECVDLPATRVSPEFEWWDRSRARTPMPWLPGAGAGFTTGRPWLRIGPDSATRNVEVQRNDPGSVLSFYRRLIALRAATPALQIGAFRPYPGGADDLVAYTRETEDQTVLVLINVARGPLSVALDGVPDRHAWRPLLATGAVDAPDERLPASTRIEIGPDSAVILEAVA